MKTILLLILTLMPGIQALAENYTVDWYKIAGGGGTSTGGVFSVVGTIGQADAGATMTGSNFSVTGGFWSLIGAVQTPGFPKLIVVSSGGTGVKVMWTNSGSYALEQSTDLKSGSWTACGFPVTSSNGTNTVTINQTSGYLFFRLK